MSKKTSYKGKIGYCDNISLGILKSGGHYVYVREDKNGKCKVNVVTSLEDIKGSINIKRIIDIRKGYVYPIPKNDSNLTRWSGISNNPKIVARSEIENIGRKSIKTRHKFYVGKFLK